MGHLKWVEFSTSLLHYSHPRSCALAKRKVCKIHHPCMLCGGCQGLRGLCFVWQWLWGIPTPKSPETRVVPLWHPSIPEDRKVAMQDHTSPLHIIHLPIVSHSQSLYESYTVAFLIFIINLDTLMSDYSASPQRTHTTLTIMISPDIQLLEWGRWQTCEGCCSWTLGRASSQPAYLGWGWSIMVGLLGLVCKPCHVCGWLERFVADLRGRFQSSRYCKRNFLSDFGPNKSGPIFFRMWRTAPACQTQA